MYRVAMFSAAVIIALSFFSNTTDVRAGANAVPPGAPGGTPGAPGQAPTPFGTLQPGQVQGPPMNAGPGQLNTPGAQATAQAGGHGRPTIIRGTLTAIDGSQLTLLLADGTTLSLGLDPETRIRVPGPQAQGDNLLVGMHVVAQASPDLNNNLVARSVMAIPGQPSRAHRVGIVTDYSPGASITILGVDGQTYTFALTAETVLLPTGLAPTLAVDSRVTVIAPRDTSALGWTAAGIVVHPTPP